MSIDDSDGVGANEEVPFERSSGSIVYASVIRWLSFDMMIVRRKSEERVFVMLPVCFSHSLTKIDTVYQILTSPSGGIIYNVS
jgi:hypothetical protein